MKFASIFLFFAGRWKRCNGRIFDLNVTVGAMINKNDTQPAVMQKKKK